MSIWSKGRGGKEAEESPALPRPTVMRLAVVEFWAADRRTVVGMDLSSGRLTDLLNREDALQVVLLDQRPEDPSAPVEMRPDQQWTEFLAADALLILPPPQATDPQRRLHRPRQPVEIVIGPFVVSGMAHVPPGAQAAGFLFRQNARFVPVTRAAVRDTGLDGFEQRAEVVLVNMRMVETVHDVGLNEPEATASSETVAPIGQESVRPPRTT